MPRFAPLAAGLVVAALAGPACTDDVDDPPVAVDADDGACPSELAEPLRAWGDAGFDGVVVVATGGAADCELATGGGGDVDRTFAIGSVSKAVTAAAVLGLVDAGRLALDDRAGDLVAGLAGPVAEATVEQLLLHTSGLTGSAAADDEPLDHDAAVAAIGGLDLAFPPGSDYLYSNAGYTLLALVVEARSGATYRDHVAREILTLADGTTFGGFWTEDPEGTGWAVAGNGDVAMSVPQLAAWTHALFTGGIVGPAAVDHIRAVGFDHGDGAGETPGWVTFDATRFGRPFYAAAGGGGDLSHNVVVAYVPEGDQVVAIGSDSEDVTAEDLLQAVGPALIAGDPLPRPDGPAPASDAIGADDLAALEGRYRLADGGFDVTVDDEGDARLVLSADGPAAVAALFDRPEGAAGHEEAVLALLAGETRTGRDELETLAEDLGAVEAVAVVGTIRADGELRTYVTVTAAGVDHLLWYALDGAGGIAAVEITDRGPTVRLVAVGDGRFEPDDPTSSGADLTVTFAGDELTVAGPSGTTTARRG